jgi:hypothetical protein
VTTKADAALQCLSVAHQIDEKLSGDDDADFWISQLAWLANDLDKGIQNHPWFDRLMYEERKPNRFVKLRALIDHPETGEHERASAVQMLNKLKAAADRDSS